MISPGSRLLRGEQLNYLAQPGLFSCDIAYLRGSQEEMWQKLLQLQMAPNPGEVFRWMIEQGVGPTLEAYGGSARQGADYARQGAGGITRGTNAPRASGREAPGHAAPVSAVPRPARESHPRPRSLFRAPPRSAA